jgi:DnaJ-class molecular chaperone
MSDQQAPGIALPPEQWDDILACTHCGGEGICMDGADPLGDCPAQPHTCHACGGSGNREDQVLF